jgi:hypothetical protein
MTALEKQFAVLRFAHLVLGRDDAPAGLRLAAEGAAHFLPWADTYCWSGESSAAVQAAALSVPESSTLRVGDLPGRVGFWWFEVPLPLALPGELLPRVGREIGALVIGPAESPTERLAVIVLRFVRPSDRTGAVLMPTSVYAVPQEATLATLRADAEVVGLSDDDRFRMRRGFEVTQFVIAAAAWLRQRILVTSDGHVERHRRRALSREFDTPVASNVKIVELRRLESEPHGPRDPNAEPVEWSCRWVVNGHWRLQPYKDERRLIYIHPFVKGPADRPLRVPTHTVNVVDR